MKTTIDHLITPRFEVIADYPNNPHQIGDILQAPKGCTSIHQTTISYTDEFGDNVKQQNHCMVSSFQSYPHLFRPLNWWEERTEEEMPRYLKFDNDKLRLHNRNHFDYFKIDHWNMAALWAMIENGGGHCNLKKFTPSYTYQPCSEEEYLANQ